MKKAKIGDIIYEGENKKVVATDRNGKLIVIDYPNTCNY